MKKLFLLLLAVALLTAAGTVKAAVYYVNASGTAGDNLIATVAQAKANPGVDTVYVAIGLYKMNTELIVEDVIFGGCTFGSNNSVTRQYPGAVGNNRNRMTVLDGNSFVLTLPNQKHRVATINKGGIIDGCLIRNGHARGTTNNPNDTKGFGGGVLINTGGKLHNSIVRGNVAMNMKFSKTNPSYGGGVYVNGGDVANCIIAFNLDDMGLGIGATHGTILNNTIARNANAPKYVLITGTLSSGGTPYQHYTKTVSLVSTQVLPYIHLNDFYMAATETTMGQYACFLAAIDLAADISALDWTAMCGARTPVDGYCNYDISISKYLGIPATNVSTPPALISTLGTNTQYLGMSGTAGSGSEVYYASKAGSPTYSAGTSGGESYPADPLVRDNFPMGHVSWYGGVAFCAWLGGMLPTEAQWEYAARKKADGSVQTEAAYTGGHTDGNKVGWHSGNGKMPHEVALLLPSGMGLYDMNGNQWEWTTDWYLNPYPIYGSTGPSAASVHNTYMSSVPGGNGGTVQTAVHNPIYNFGGSTRVLRGGAWYGVVFAFALGYRLYSNASYLLGGYIGFRCAGCANCP